jgi:putative pyruvate formate lyase activating enzyme
MVNVQKTNCRAGADAPAHILFYASLGGSATNMKKMEIMGNRIDKRTYENCTLCPRSCAVDRSGGQRGVCGQTAVVKLARAALHFWEEPCISGTRGSGAVFFCGCPLHCVFCQNQPIASGTAGKEISDGRLAEIFLELQEQGANNINLVTPGHFAPHIIRAVERARCEGLSLPIVYNTGSYENVDTIRAMEGIVDVYLPDFKYMNDEIAEKYSHAKDYPRTAMAAIDEMVRQQPNARFEWEGGQIPIMKNGVIVRHLLLPGQLHDSRQILKYLYGRYGNQIYYSLMSQYTPLAHVKDYPELDRRVSEEAYDSLVSYAVQLGITNGFTQEREVANSTFIPYFDGEGV